MPVFQRISILMLLVSILGGCASLPEAIQHPIEPIRVQPNSTLSALFDNKRSELNYSQTGENAVLLLESGWDALAQRLALVEAAEHSIDIQYYIWNSDTSGRYLASRLLAAADRGVRIRVMLDDINLNERDDLLMTLDEHANIEIRIFNPIPSRHGLAKWGRVLGDFSRLNRRMHNKSFTVDETASIVGGRNIGDEYFDLSDDINFRDRDVLVFGPVIPEIQASFAQYWNSTWSYPVNVLANASAVDVTMLKKVNSPHYSNYPLLPVGKASATQLLTDAMDEMLWVQAYFISDRPVPSDVADSSQPKETAKLLAELAAQTEQAIILESAYLIFDDAQLEGLQALTNKGVEIKVLTNSMASNDLIANHSGYAGRRQAMLEHGLQLFELQPDTGLCAVSTKDPSKCAPTTAYGLHAKSAVFDRQIATIGSFNFNLRSTYLNTESLLVIENKVLSERLANTIEQAMHEENSWRLEVDNGDVRWYSGSRSWSNEPETGKWERMQSWFLQLLPIEKYL